MGETKHPAAGLKSEAIYAFEALAIHQCERLTPETISILVNHGLIETVLLGDSPAGGYFVPLHHHRQWCDWCSENYDPSWESWVSTEEEFAEADYHTESAEYKKRAGGPDVLGELETLGEES